MPRSVLPTAKTSGSAEPQDNSRPLAAGATAREKNAVRRAAEESDENLTLCGRAREKNYSFTKRYELRPCMLSLEHGHGHDKPVCVQTCARQKWRYVLTSKFRFAKKGPGRRRAASPRRLEAHARPGHLSAYSLYTHLLLFCIRVASFKRDWWMFLYIISEALRRRREV